MFIHLDGARISNAAAALGLPLRALTTDVGVDVLSLGGTKNGALGAEAVVVLNDAASAALPGGIADRLRQRFRFYDWDSSKGEVRWVCSFDTTAEDVEALSAAMRADVSPAI